MTANAPDKIMLKHHTVQGSDYIWVSVYSQPKDGSNAELLFTDKPTEIIAWVNMSGYKRISKGIYESLWK